MSNIVGGSVSHGKDDNQVVFNFSGMLPADRWAEFIQAIIRTAEQFGVAVERHGE